MTEPQYDFSGWATKNDVLCSDGRTIRKDAFKECDGKFVPLVWSHLHNEPKNILGHALLSNRPEGVYTQCSFNDTEDGQYAKKLVNHKDIVALSIFANELIEKSKNVFHGVIREVSLVLAGANPEARIEHLMLVHGDGEEDTEEDREAVIFGGLNIDRPEKKELEHSADAPAQPEASNDETVADIVESMTDKQKQALYAIVGAAVEENSTAAEVKQSNEGESEVMKANVFDKDLEVKGQKNFLTHAQFSEIVTDAFKMGSFKQSFLVHAPSYGIENIELLFPDAQTLTNDPAMISRRMEWVSGVINGTNHSPFSRVKTIQADITADIARARGYIKGNLKKDEVIKLLSRITTPKTIYKKQKLDRDDIIDITGLDIVAWLKAEMRVMLDEEIARAILVSDGRAADDEDKIDEEHIRPVWTDNDMFAHHIAIPSDMETDDIIDAIIRARKFYRGSGSPTLYTTTEFMSDMLMLKDTIGRRIYATEAELKAVLRVQNIVEVPVMTDLARETDDDVPLEVNLVGIIVNLKDYTLGADKGGQVSMFDDFDIDYNQYKYLLEARLSGALTLPKSALVIEQVVE